MPTETVLVAIGAVCGALSRYTITEWTRAKLGPEFPYGTFLINLTGCFCMGFFFVLGTRIPGYPPALDLALRTGFLGSYTTFSAYGWDTLTLWRYRSKLVTLFYWLFSAVFGFLALDLGIYCGRLLLS